MGRSRPGWLLLIAPSWQRAASIARSRYNRIRGRSVETMHTDGVAEFLGKFPPFDVLEPAELAALAGSVEERVYEPGEVVLLEDGAPAEHLFVVREGAVELMHQGEVVDVVGPGESFGHPSLLSGLAPAFTVRARERTVCILIPREAAVAVFTAPAGAGYLAASLRHRMVRAGHVVHALPE